MAGTAEPVHLDVCDGCKLGAIDIGGDWLAAHEALTSLSSVYPEDDSGIPKVLSDQELEEISQTEIKEWREIGPDGERMVEFLKRVPEIVIANYACDRRRALGRCAFVQARNVRVGE